MHRQVNEFMYYDSIFIYDLSLWRVFQIRNTQISKAGNGLFWQGV